MMRANPKRGRSVLIKLLFNGERRLALGQTRAVANAENIRVDGECLGPKGGVHHDIGGFASDAGQAF